MTMRVAINGFGRMGRLALRAAWGFAPDAPSSLTAPSGLPATLTAGLRIAAPLDFPV